MQELMFYIFVIDNGQLMLAGTAWLELYHTVVDALDVSVKMTECYEFEGGSQLGILWWKSKEKRHVNVGILCNTFVFQTITSCL